MSPLTQGSQRTYCPSLCLKKHIIYTCLVSLSIKIYLQIVPSLSRARCISQRTHDELITSLLRQNDVATSFWRNHDVIITSCARGESYFISANKNDSQHTSFTWHTCGLCPGKICARQNWVMGHAYTCISKIILTRSVLLRRRTVYLVETNDHNFKQFQLV